MSFPVFRFNGLGHGPVNYPMPLLTPAEITHINTDTYRLCVNNIQPVIVRGSNSGTNSNLKFGGLMSILTGIVSFLVFHRVK